MDTTKMAPSRDEARARGDTLFFTGIPCKRGHIAARYTTSPVCIECAKCNYAKRRGKTLTELKAAYRSDPEKFRAKERQRAKSNPKRYWAKHVLKNAANRAAKLGVPFDLDTAYLLTIIPDVCPVFGTGFVFVGNGAVCHESASLDRLVPAKGYIRGNVTVISHLANTIKQNVSAKEVARVAQWMYDMGL